MVQFLWLLYVIVIILSISMFGDILIIFFNCFALLVYMVFLLYHLQYLCVGVLCGCLIPSSHHGCPSAFTQFLNGCPLIVVFSLGSCVFVCGKCVFCFWFCLFGGCLWGLCFLFFVSVLLFGVVCFSRSSMKVDDSLSVLMFFLFLVG